jgi:hypothetical protein
VFPPTNPKSTALDAYQRSPIKIIEQEELTRFKWTAVSPDTGVAAVLDRLVQIEPKILFADNGVRYNGKVHESMTKVKEITKALNTLQAVVMFESMPGVDSSISQEHLPSTCKAYAYQNFAVLEEFKAWVNAKKISLHRYTLHSKQQADSVKQVKESPAGIHSTAT